MNHYSIDFIDPQWGPGFLKICSYPPYTMKLCLNGHERAKRQLRRAGIAFEALDTGFRTCSDPVALQQVCGHLSPADILACFDRRRAVLPLPLLTADHRAGFAYRLSILQMEISRTQVFNRPLRGREFFEQVIRDTLDLGRPDRVPVLFDRTIIRTTPGRFSTRVTHGVIPRLHIEYWRCHVKQYFKEARVLPTETTVNDAYDFGITPGLSRFGRLRDLGQSINTRALEAERVTKECGLAEANLAALVQSGRTARGQAAPGLKLGQPRVSAHLHAVCLLSLTPAGLTNARRPPDAGLRCSSHSPIHDCTGRDCVRSTRTANPEPPRPCGGPTPQSTRPSRPCSRRGMSRHNHHEN
ncbi:MAG: hypothetical protein ACKVVP_04275 [Chloroflexota bacterium]